MTNYVHFVYIGDIYPAQNIIQGPLRIIDSCIKNKSCDTLNIQFKFWFDNNWFHEDEWGRCPNSWWKTNINFLRTRGSYQKIERDTFDILEKSKDQIPENISNHLKVVDDRNIITKAKRNIIKKDMCALAILKEFGGYFMDNNIFPIGDGPDLDFIEGKSDFKIPASTDPELQLQLFGFRLLEIKKKEAKYQFLLYVDNDKGVFDKYIGEKVSKENMITIKLPFTECWMMYAKKDSKIIEMINEHYLKNLIMCQTVIFSTYDIIDESKEIEDFLVNNVGVGRIIIDAILVSITTIVYNDKSNDIAVAISKKPEVLEEEIQNLINKNRNYFWDWEINEDYYFGSMKVNRMTTFIDKAVYKIYGNFWKNSPVKQMSIKNLY